MSVILKKYKGESATFGFMLPGSYDLSNLENVRVFVGNQIYSHTVENERLFKVALKSEDTIFMAGRLSVIFDIDDSVFGIKKVLVGEFQVENTTDTFSDASANTGIDVTFALSISETSITIDSVLYDVLKGDSAFQVWQSQPNNANKTYEQYIAYLREPMTEAIEDGNEVAAQWAIDEAERVANELIREENEEDRNAAELIREQVKDATIIAKNDAIQAAIDANEAEELRAAAETLRDGAENVREENEDERILNEQARIAAENLRVNKFITVTLLAANWVAYVQTVNAAGVTSDTLTNHPIIGAPINRNELFETANCGVSCVSQGAGTLTFNCEIVPLINITFNVEIQ